MTLPASVQPFVGEHLLATLTGLYGVSIIVFVAVVASDVFGDGASEIDAMQVEVNGQKAELSPETTVATLVASYELEPQRVAVEVNGELVRRPYYGETTLHKGDHVEIVTLVGGG